MVPDVQGEGIWRYVKFQQFECFHFVTKFVTSKAEQTRMVVSSLYDDIGDTVQAFALICIYCPTVCISLTMMEFLFLKEGFIVGFFSLQHVTLIQSIFPCDSP